jgi:hypothetical protein
MKINKLSLHTIYPDAPVLAFQTVVFLDGDKKKTPWTICGWSKPEVGFVYMFNEADAYKEVHTSDVGCRWVEETN